MAYTGTSFADNATLLVDDAWVDNVGERHVDREIFDAVFEIIDDAEQFLLIDFFLVNDFLYQPGPGMRPISQELTDRLLAKRKADPDVEIIFITDPINTVYHSVESPNFKALEQAGVQVVWTDLDRLRDSNPMYSKPWRLLAKPLGTGPGNALENPLGDGRISMRSMLKLLNFKANHRKVIVSEKSVLVTSANPHSASSAHWNVGLRIDGAGMDLACEAESAILRLSGHESFVPSGKGVVSPAMIAEDGEPSGRYQLELLTEIKIKDRVLELLAAAGQGSRVELSMFYLSERDILKALVSARDAGADIRVILDPNKDAFGRTKNGIPNRQSAARLVKAGIPLRWAETHGEQFHVKMLYVQHPDRTATLLLGSCNYSRRNMDNFNGECDLAVTGPAEDAVMIRARDTFERWWSNPDGRIYTANYATYEDDRRFRKVQAWLMEITGLSSF